MLFRPVRRYAIRRAATPVALLAAVLVAGAALPARSAPAPAASPTAAQAATAQAGTELSETTPLADRPSPVVGARAYAMGDEPGLCPATGWHIRGEMGGFWTQPIKMLDGVWFALGSQWLGGDAGGARDTSRPGDSHNHSR